MQFRYSTTDPSQNETDSLPRVPVTLRKNGKSIDAVGLVDSGATVNVLPYEVGLQLGETWDERRSSIRLAGGFGSHPAIPLVCDATIFCLPSAKLAFAWVKTSQVPLILGETNFFMEFDVHFYRSRLVFEIDRKSD
jgi:hypothetical protein